MAFLEINNYKKSFGNFSVLKGVNFTLEKGQVLSIIGPSGSGKSTLLRSINFLETPDEGTMVLDGQTLFDASTCKKDGEKVLRRKRLDFAASRKTVGIGLPNGPHPRFIINRRTNP